MQRHAAHVLQGEYRIPGLVLPGRPRILDIGANVGAFAVWAAHEWPGARIECFEPHPANYRILVENVAACCAGGKVVTREVAVLTTGPMVLYEGANNCGEHSAWRGHEQTDKTVAVLGISPADLPAFDVAKIDTEGAEKFILTGMPEGHIAGASAIMLEWHSASDRKAIAELLRDYRMTLISDEARTADRGVQKWVRR